MVKKRTSKANNGPIFLLVIGIGLLFFSNRNLTFGNGTCPQKSNITINDLNYQDTCPLDGNLTFNNGV